VQKEGGFRDVICNYPHLFVDLQQTVVENKRLVYAYQAFSVDTQTHLNKEQKPNRLAESGQGRAGTTKV
jgi:hypothetical protein